MVDSLQTIASVADTGLGRVPQRQPCGKGLSSHTPMRRTVRRAKC